MAALALVIAACGAGDGDPAVRRDLPDEGVVSAATVTEPADRTVPPPSEPGLRFELLVFTRTLGFRHDVLGAPGAFDGPAPAALGQLAAGDGPHVVVDFTEDPAAFTDANLAGYDAVVFLHTTGDVLDEAGQAALERYVAGGGGFAGVHSAADTEYDWAWYGELVGAYFASHPPVTPAVVRVEDRNHPSTAHLPAEWARADEWYAFRSNPRDRVHVLATVDESSYEPGGAAMGADHPIVWCHTIGAGRAWYTALGHTAESYADPVFREHLWNGIKSVAGAVAANC